MGGSAVFHFVLLCKADKMREVNRSVAGYRVLAGGCIIFSRDTNLNRKQSFTAADSPTECLSSLISLLMARTLV